MNELIKVEEITPEVFQKERLEEILKRVEGEALSIVIDPSTKKGRDEIGSLAYKISQSKTTIDSVGKDMVSDWKNKAKKVDELRRMAREKLESIRDKVLEPRTKWEEAEEKRQQVRVLAIESIRELSVVPIGTNSEEIRDRLKKVGTTHDSIDDWMEFADPAQGVFNATVDTLTNALEAQVKAEAQEAELAKLREEAEKREAEAKEAARKKEEEERIKVAEKAAEERALKKAAEEQAEKERLAKAREVEAEATRLAQAHQADLKARNVNHRREINCKAVEALRLVILNSEDPDDEDEGAVAKAVVRAIAKGEIPNVSIEY
jgi:hypothetical protein